MKKTSGFCRIICFILAVIFIAVPAYAADEEVDMSIVQGCRTIDAAMPMHEPIEDLSNLSAAFLFDVTNDTLVYAVNPDQQYYPASLVKIMTGLIIAQKGNLNDQVTVRQDVLDTLSYDSLSIDLKAGEIMSLQDLLYCLLVSSANEAAAVAADYIGGSQEAFVKQMNEYADELGCTSTNFTNVHGLHNEEQLTTARDIAKILAVAAENEIFMQAFTTVSYTVPATNLSKQRELSSSNYLMNTYDYMDSRVTGGRTGIIQSGERNLAVTAEKNDVTLISVVLGSASELSESGYSVKRHGAFKETTALLDIGFAEQQTVQVFYENQVLKQYEVKNGENNVTAYVKDAVQTSLPQNVTLDDLNYLYAEESTGISAPVTAGDRLSSVQIWYKNICLAEADLYALHDVDVKEVVETEEIAEEKGAGTFTVLIATAVIVGLLIVLLFGRRVIFRIIRRHQIRRSRSNRRRSR